MLAYYSQSKSFCQQISNPEYLQIHSDHKVTTCTCIQVLYMLSQVTYLEIEKPFDLNRVRKNDFEIEKCRFFSKQFLKLRSDLRLSTS